MQDQVAGYVCTCAERFTGPQCEQDVDYCISRPCQNNGTCAVSRIMILGH